MVVQADRPVGLADLQVGKAVGQWQMCVVEEVVLVTMRPGGDVNS